MRVFYQTQMVDIRRLGGKGRGVGFCGFRGGQGVPRNKRGQVTWACDFRLPALWNILMEADLWLVRRLRHANVTFYRHANENPRVKGSAHHAMLNAYIGCDCVSLKLMENTNLLNANFMKRSLRDIKLNGYRTPCNVVLSFVV